MTLGYFVTALLVFCVSVVLLLVAAGLVVFAILRFPEATADHTPMPYRLRYAAGYALIGFAFHLLVMLQTIATGPGQALGLLAIVAYVLAAVYAIRHSYLLDMEKKRQLKEEQRQRGEEQQRIREARADARVVSQSLRDSAPASEGPLGTLVVGTGPAVRDIV